MGAMGYNARNEEIRDNITRMRKEWEARRGALATVRPREISGHAPCETECPLWVTSGHVQRTSSCPLWANSGHKLDTKFIRALTLRTKSRRAPWFLVSYSRVAGEESQRRRPAL
jgi:hypothetical protein